MDLTGKKVVLFVDQMYQEMEVWVPLYRLKEAGVAVVTVGPKAGGTYTSKLGYPCVAEKAYEDVNAMDFDGVIVPGGWAPDYMRRNSAATKFVAETNQQGKLVAAICHGPWLLCSAHGMLKGRKLTSFFAIKDDCINAGASWTDAEVVVDANLVTSRKPEDLPAFNRACLAVLAGK
ncbi:MAG: type 1 glutamine amidotransferase [Bryobacter sp.]|jgi:protease I|nr:type 1 glutamine amidotransferase [Bryobacter sp.]